jgi:RNA polymerase sigma factor (sigma-70 family)
MADFEALLGRARAGDERAISTLLEQCEPEIRRSARALLGRLLRPYIDSVDVAQSVQVALLLGFRDRTIDVSTPEKLAGLAARMVRNKVADHWRRVRRRDRLLDRRLEDRDLGALLASAGDGADDPARLARQEAVDKLLDGLEDPDRRVLELRLLGHSTADVARALRLDPDVLRVRLSRIRKRLRDRRLLADWI